MFIINRSEIIYHVYASHLQLPELFCVIEKGIGLFEVVLYCCFSWSRAVTFNLVVVFNEVCFIELNTGC